MTKFSHRVISIMERRTEVISLDCYSAFRLYFELLEDSIMIVYVFHLIDVDFILVLTIIIT